MIWHSRVTSVAPSALPSSNEHGASRRRGYRNTFHERVIRDILQHAEGYVHRPRRLSALSDDKVPAGDSNGAIIRRRIAANAQKRFEIAEAMKAEAGVFAHQITRERGGGIAWTDRARILAPAGENRVQLATLAHECGHVFLHAKGTPGFWLPGHVQEMEAESYAHQAFAAHGMRMPAQVTSWGRRYVGEWVEADRANGVRIDPRAEAYANGTRSPFEPLRAVPLTWRLSGSPLLRFPEEAAVCLPAADPSARPSVFYAAWWKRKALAVLAKLQAAIPVHSWVRSIAVLLNRDNVVQRPPGLKREALSILGDASVLISAACRSTIRGAFVGWLGIHVVFSRDGTPPRSLDELLFWLSSALLIGVVWACVVLSWKLFVMDGRRT